MANLWELELDSLPSSAFIVGNSWASDYISSRIAESYEKVVHVSSFAQSKINYPHDTLVISRGTDDWTGLYNLIKDRGLPYLIISDPIKDDGFKKLRAYSTKKKTTFIHSNSARAKSDMLDHFTFKWHVPKSVSKEALQLLDFDTSLVMQLDLLVQSMLDKVSPQYSVKPLAESLRIVDPLETTITCFLTGDFSGFDPTVDKNEVLYRLSSLIHTLSVVLFYLDKGVPLSVKTLASASSLDAHKILQVIPYVKNFNMDKIYKSIWKLDLAYRWINYESMLGWLKGGW